MERDSEHPAPAAPLVKVIDLAPGGAEAAQHLAQAAQLRDDTLRQIARAYALPQGSVLVPIVAHMEVAARQLGAALDKPLADSARAAQRLLYGDGRGR